MHVFWRAVLVLVVIHLRWTQVLVELSVVHFVPDCTSVRRWAWRAGVGAGDGASPGSPNGHFEDHVAVYVSASRRTRSRSGSSARGTVTRGRPSPPAAVYPPVNRGVLAVPAIKLRMLSSLSASCASWGCVQLPQQHVSTY